MPLSKLELTSGHGDKTLASVRFVLHGASSITETVSVRDAGLPFAEGQPVVTSNLGYALSWAKSAGDAGQPGSMFVVALPPNFHLGYGVFTTAYIDRELKRVSGAPLRYAAARKQLALYKSAETEAARIHIESEVANGYPLAQQPRIQVDRQYLVGDFSASEAFGSLARQLEGEVGNLQALDTSRLEQSLVELFKPAQPAHAVLAASAAHGFVNGTIESLVMERLRLMRWQGLALLGYRFFEGREQVAIPPVADIDTHRRRLEEVSRQLASTELFGAELAWLKTFAIQQLELMKIELDGELLSEQSDSPTW